ncbi:ABC transporter ATP-binding protein [Actinopolymorpha pittospori]|uniref:ABC transporter ATP-binding protein n=1 Tax=Actinopolymorpha pittospori TaxID=648752 RepID=UPI001EE32177|nr:ABC transporter ATP-binding protein [Actinopolymorpha pittospori]
MVALWIVLIGLTGALSAAFALLVARVVTQLPRAVRDGFDSLAGNDLQSTLAAMALVLVADAVVSAGRVFVQADLYRRYEEYLLARVMAATLSAPGLALFEDPTFADRIDKTAVLAREEPGDLVDGLAEKWGARVQGLASAVLVATVWPLAAVLLAIVWILVGRRLQADYRLIEAEGGSLAMRRAGYLKNIALMPTWAKELRIFGLAGWVADGYRRHRSVVIDHLATARRVNRRDWVLLLVAVIASNVAVLLWAAHAVIDGAMSAGAVTVLVQGLVGVGMLANQEGDLLIGYGASRVPDVIEVENAVATLAERPAGTIAALGAVGTAAGLPHREIRLEQVTFSYPGRDAPVYADLDLRIEAGQSLAIVGLNGAGKTTLAKLLTGLETPQGGRITIDGIAVSEIDPLSWRRGVAAIFQDFVHYQLSAADNIGFGAIEHLHDRDASDRIVEAASRAGAGQLLAELPDGPSTPLSAGFAGGVDLSGGQWQRIALARAMRAVQAGAKLLILDEPTAHLDVRAEADLYDRFLDLTHGLTTIVISHRFSTVRHADRIVVLDNGRISEDGSHEQLVAAGGTYARLFSKQAMRYTDAERTS